MIRWTGLAPWEFEFPLPGSLTSTLLSQHATFRFQILNKCEEPGNWFPAVSRPYHPRPCTLNFGSGYTPRLASEILTCDPAPGPPLQPVKASAPFSEPRNLNPDSLFSPSKAKPCTPLQPGKSQTLPPLFSRTTPRLCTPFLPRKIPIHALPFQPGKS